MKKAIFVDRDGTLIQEVGYLKMIDDLRFTYKATEALRMFKELGYLNIVITNQSAVARGILSPKELRKIHLRLKLLAKEEGALIDDIFFCPHLPAPGGRVSPYNVECECRKPKAGMIVRAQEKYHLDLQQCILVGDKVSDLEMARHAGLRGVLVLTGYGGATRSQWVESVDTYPNLYEFARNLSG